MKKDMAAFTAPPEYSLTVDFKKICWEVMEGWVMQRVTELLRGVEDEVLVGTILESLKDVRDRSQQFPCLSCPAWCCPVPFNSAVFVQKEGTKPRDLHHDLVPFLANNTTLFIKVWLHRLCLPCSSHIRAVMVNK